MEAESNIRVTPAPPYKPSRMPVDHRLFLRVLQGLREGEAMRLHCDDPEELIPMDHTIRSFIDRMAKEKRLDNHLSVLRRKEEESLIIYIIKREGNQKGK